MKNVTYLYKVEGKGRFPVDMLRYDRTFPASESDSTPMREAIENPYKHDGIRINLKSDRKPTLGRWQSFGWNVMEITELKA